jgi:hypothetical protein
MMNSDYNSDYAVKPSVRVKAPVVGVDLNAITALTWPESALAQHIPAIERLLMLDANAPVTFDGIPMRSAAMRSKALVDGVTQSFNANPNLAPMIRHFGAALKIDRAARLLRTEDVGVQELTDVIARQIEVKVTYRPRG